MALPIEVDAVFRVCFKQHVRERVPECKDLSEEEIDALISEYNRFMIIKFYIFLQRVKYQESLSADELEKYFPLHIEVPKFIQIAWERHILWTASYRNYCLNTLGVFIESALDLNDEESHRLKSDGYAVVLTLYRTLFHDSAPEPFWPLSSRQISPANAPLHGEQELYPSLEDVRARGYKDPALSFIANLAASCGHDDVEPFEHFLFPKEFAQPFRVFICNKEPCIAALSIDEYEELVSEYIKFLIVMKTVVIGRDVYHPNLNSREIDFLYPDNVAPSNIVDLIWHGHLLCTVEYRTYCSTKFGKFMDHHPTIMNTQFARNDNQGYENTIRVYEELFSVIPSYKWWSRHFNGPAGHPSYRSSMRRDMMEGRISIQENPVLQVEVPLYHSLYIRIADVFETFSDRFLKRGSEHK